MDGNVLFHHTKSFMALLKALLYTEKDPLPFDIVFCCCFLFLLCKRQAAGNVPVSGKFEHSRVQHCCDHWAEDRSNTVFLVIDLFSDHCQSLIVLRRNCTLVLIFTDRLFPGASRWPKERMAVANKEMISSVRSSLIWRALHTNNDLEMDSLWRWEETWWFFFLEHVRIYRFSSEYWKEAWTEECTLQWGSGELQLAVSSPIIAIASNKINL